MSFVELAPLVATSREDDRRRETVLGTVLTGGQTKTGHEGVPPTVLTEEMSLLPTKEGEAHLLDEVIGEEGPDRGLDLRPRGGGLTRSGVTTSLLWLKTGKPTHYLKVYRIHDQVVHHEAYPPITVLRAPPGRVRPEEWRSWSRGVVAASDRILFYEVTVLLVVLNASSTL